MTYLSTPRDQLVLAAHKAVKEAITAGLLPKQKDCKCVDCGKQAQCYDHRDYRKPLDVQPVCRGCNNRRGPGLPILEKEDAGKYKREWMRDNCGMKYSELDAGEGFAPLSARLNGIDSNDLEHAIQREVFSEEVKKAEKFMRNKEMQRHAISVKDGQRMLGSSPGRARAQFFKEHDPWFSPFF